MFYFMGKEAQQLKKFDSENRKLFSVPFLLFVILFSSHPIYLIVPPTFKIDLFFSVEPLQNYPQCHTQRCVSQAILKPFQFIVTVKHNWACLGYCFRTPWFWKIMVFIYTCISMHMHVCTPVCVYVCELIEMRYSTKLPSTALKYMSSVRCFTKLVPRVSRDF